MGTKRRKFYSTSAHRKGEKTQSKITTLKHITRKVFNLLCVRETDVRIHYSVRHVFWMLVGSFEALRGGGLDIVRGEI